MSDGISFVPTGLRVLVYLDYEDITGKNEQFEAELREEKTKMKGQWPEDSPTFLGSLYSQPKRWRISSSESQGQPV